MDRKNGANGVIPVVRAALPAALPLRRSLHGEGPGPCPESGGGLPCSRWRHNSRSWLTCLLLFPLLLGPSSNSRAFELSEEGRVAKAAADRKTEEYAKLPDSALRHLPPLQFVYVPDARKEEIIRRWLRAGRWTLYRNPSTPFYCNAVLDALLEWRDIRIVEPKIRAIAFDDPQYDELHRQCPGSKLHEMEFEQVGLLYFGYHFKLYEIPLASGAEATLLYAEGLRPRDEKPWLYFAANENELKLKSGYPGYYLWLDRKTCSAQPRIEAGFPAAFTWFYEEPERNKNGAQIKRMSHETIIAEIDSDYFIVSINRPPEDITEERELLQSLYISKVPSGSTIKAFQDSSEASPEVSPLPRLAPHCSFESVK